MMFRRLKEIALADMLAIRWTLAWACVAMGVGFLISGTDNENYVLLNNIFPKELWGIGFIALGLFSVFLCFITANILLVSISTICAVWLWSYIFFSFTLFDPTPIKSTEWLLAIPIIIELWVFVNMSAHKFKPREFDKHFANSLEVMITGIHNQLGGLNIELERINRENNNLRIEISILSEEVVKLRSRIHND